MGVQISAILPKTELELESLTGKKIAIDAFNIIFQFLSIIRQRETGEPLRDSKGRVTSHLSGLFYRNLRLLEAGIRPIYVFDGEPPLLKKDTIKQREERRDDALKKWTEAVKEGRKEDIMVYAQASSKLTDEMIEESKALLESMGIPCVQAKSEGEAQASYMVINGDAYAVGSQDSDSLLFGCPRLIRNLSITGRRKLPRQERWIEVKPELIELNKTLEELGITKEQLIIVGMLVGTDYNKGVEGYGPKKALKLVKEKGNLKNVLKEVEWTSDNNPEEILHFFLNPPLEKNYKIEWKEIDREKIKKIMVDEHEFSEERIENGINKISELKKAGKQSSLSGWFK